MNDDFKALFEAGKKLAETENEELLKTVRKHNADELKTLSAKLPWLDEIEMAKLIHSLYTPASLAARAASKHFQAQGKVLQGHPFDGSSEAIRLVLGQMLSTIILEFIAAVKPNQLVSLQEWIAENETPTEPLPEKKPRAEKKRG